MNYSDWFAAGLRWLKRLVRNTVPVGRLSYSQEGEDLLLARIFDPVKKDGFYVDVGAHHPVRYSNTYYFYRRGWRGINIDPIPGTVKLFKRMRPRDIAVECGIGPKKGVLRYYIFNEPALNTFSKAEARKKDHEPYRILDEIKVPVVTLADLLEQYLPEGANIDFMSIDTEGMDYEVIASNDWTRFCPSVVMIELLNTSIENLSTSPSAKLLDRYGYRVFAKTCNTYFFVKKTLAKNWAAEAD